MRIQSDVYIVYTYIFLSKSHLKRLHICIHIDHRLKLVCKYN